MLKIGLSLLNLLLKTLHLLLNIWTAILIKLLSPITELLKSPKRFVKIRYYSLLGNRYRKQNLILCRYLLKVYVNELDNKLIKEAWQETLFRLTDKDLSVCPECSQRKMILANELHIRPLLPLHS